MTLLYIIITLTAVIAVTGTIIDFLQGSNSYIKSIKDDNDNMIPDQVEDVVKEVKKRGKRVKQEVDAVAEEIAQAIDAVKGKKKKK